MKNIILLLDFDGTLAPIVRRPHLARMAPALRRQITRLAKKPGWTVGVVSGRDLKTVRQKVRIPGIIYAGNHGYEILFPGKKVIVHPAARKARKLISALCADLRKALRKIPGALVENKIYSASLHTRTLTPKAEREAERIFMNGVKGALKKRQIIITRGKKVLEIRPPARWDKGKAVLYILKNLKKKCFPIYIGDDKTDEDAFKALRKKGLGIRVGKKTRTHARRTIPSVRQLPALLKKLERIPPRVVQRGG